MFHRNPATPHDRLSIPRVGGVALAVGAALPVPTAALALAWGPAEAAKPVLIPAAQLLWGVTGGFEEWPGAVALTVVSVVNGGLYAAVAMAFAGVARRLQERNTPPG